MHKGKISTLLVIAFSGIQALIVTILGILAIVTEPTWGSFMSPKMWSDIFNVNGLGLQSIDIAIVIISLAWVMFGLTLVTGLLCNKFHVLGVINFIIQIIGLGLFFFLSMLASDIAKFTTEGSAEIMEGMAGCLLLACFIAAGISLILLVPMTFVGIILHSKRNQAIQDHERTLETQKTLVAAAQGGVVHPNLLPATTPQPVQPAPQPAMPQKPLPAPMPKQVVKPMPQKPVVATQPVMPQKPVQPAPQPVMPQPVMPQKPVQPAPQPVMPQPVMPQPTQPMMAQPTQPMMAQPTNANPVKKSSKPKTTKKAVKKPAKKTAAKKSPSKKPSGGAFGMKNKQHIVKHGNEWAIKKSNAKKATKVFRTQKEAIEYGSKMSGGSKKLTVHSKKGPVRKK